MVPSHLLVAFCIQLGIGLGGGGVPCWRGVVQYICLVEIQPVDGYVAVCLFFTIDLYASSYVNKSSSVKLLGQIFSHYSSRFVSYDRSGA